MSGVVKNLHCYICDSKAGLSVKNTVALFDDSTTLQSGLKLQEVLGELFDKKLVENDVHSSVVCMKCHKSIVDYDEMKIWLLELKNDLTAQYKNTLKKYTNTKKTEALKNDVIKMDTPKAVTKKLVLPASKLKPLPPNYVILNRGNIKVGKLPTNYNSIINKPNTSTASSTAKAVVPAPSVKISTVLNKSLAKGTSLLMNQVPRVSQNKIESKLNKSGVLPTLTIDASVLTSNTVPSILNSASSFDLSVNQSMPTDFLSPEKASQAEDLENNDEQPMEIDEECTYNTIKTNESDLNKILEEARESENNEKDDEKNKRALFEISLLPTLEETESNMAAVETIDNVTKDNDEFVIGKVEIMDDEDNVLEDNDHAILMEDGESGSIIRVVSGQKLMYGDNEISLIIPQGDSDLDSVHDSSEDMADIKNESHESNDESQIELQMSGDEETAKAIIKAAKEQGGAYIKVKSGTMYRVASVEAEKEVNTMDSAQYIVEKVGKMYRCLLCANSSTEAEAFVGPAAGAAAHARRAHGARVYICDACGLVARRRADYARHAKMHVDEANSKRGITTDKTKQYECNVCYKKFSSRNLLAEHAHAHSGARPHACACGKRFASKYTHQAHLKTHLDRPRPYTCCQCGKSFFTQQNLNQHEKTHSGIKDFVCKICGKAFGTQHNLEVHGVVHSGHKPFVCGVCGKAFARRAEIKDHMRIHTGERPFSCELCGATFSQRSNLQSHKRATHYDDKRYACAHCEKRFKRRRLLDYHIKASHTGERPFNCEVCKATFVYPEHYKKHVRIHSGEKPYQCEVCGKSFNSRDNRNAHRFVHSDKKPYECVACGAGYMRKPLLYAHMNTSGHLSETIVVNQPRVATASESSDTTIHTTSVSVDSIKPDQIKYVQGGALLKAIDEALDDNEGSNKSNTDGDDSTKTLISGDRRFLFQDDQQLYEVDLDGASAAVTRQISFDSDELTGKATLNLVQDNDNPNLLTLTSDNIMSVAQVKSEIGDMEVSLEGKADEEPQYIVARDESGAMVRLVQIQMPDGGNGCVAIVTCDNGTN